VSARIWFARDTGYTSDPKVQILGDEHGPGGPLVVEEMLALAKLRNNGGSLAISYASLARRSFVSTDRARKVVAHAADMELIEMVEQTAKDFTARFPRWARWQVKDPTGAERKARLRERERNGEVT
jgi:hypothetical protein